MPTKVSALNPATTLDGSEVVYLVQGGASVRTTVGDIVAMAGGGSGGSVGQLKGINDQTVTGYTLALTDAGKDVRCTNAAAVALTVPPDSSVAFPIGTWLLFSQGGAGAVTATPGSGVTINGANGLATVAQYDVRGLEKVAANTWRVV